MTKKLERSNTDRVLTGVCGGIAQYFGIDAGLVRVLTVVLTAFTGVGLVVYLAAAVLLPDAVTGQTVLGDLFNKGSRPGTSANGPTYRSDDLR